MATKGVGYFGKRWGTKPSGLTQTQEDVLQKIANGFSMTDIANITYRSRNTITTHRNDILNRLCVNTTCEAVADGFRKGFLK